MKILIKVTKDVLLRSYNCQAVTCETQKDFDNKVGIGFNCAIGIAVGDLIPNAWVSFGSIHVYGSYQQLQLGLPLASIELPVSAKQFIQKFDDLRGAKLLRLSMPELSFEVDLPLELIDAIGINEVYKVLSESKTLELVEP